MLPLPHAQVRQRGLHQEERPLEVDRVDAVPLLLGDALEAAELHDAGDVGQYVDAAVLGAASRSRRPRTPWSPRCTRRR